MPTVLKFQDFITAENGFLSTDSLKVAAVHGKRHDNVLQLIKKRMREAGDWGLLNFKEGSYYDPRNQQNHQMFTMTKDGYAFLVGKMTGKKAVEHQIAYIMAFNAMEAYIKNQREGLTYRCLKKELECKASEEKGTFHGRGLNQRRLEKPILEAELQALQNQVQPSLLN